MSSRLPNIGRGAVVTACDLLEGIRTNAEIETILLELGLDDYVPSQGSIAKTLLNLKRFSSRNADFEVETDFGTKALGWVLIEVAIKKIDYHHGTAAKWDKLERYLNISGFALTKEIETCAWADDKVKISGICIGAPVYAAIPETFSEVDILLSRFGMSIPETHLTNAKETYLQGNWEAANGQIRTFFEALTDTIADKLFPSEASSRKGGLHKRQLLADKGFLSREKHEFSDGNGHAFVPGLAKLLHPDGAHPGVTTKDDALFRMQIVVSTAHWLLKRFEEAIRTR
ncbi:hypothetical protein [Leisingera aquimarina]|uniref:hypothetical protein n=1 Tax=Leisingera aquimarina TaxID=476529 RepID=UPI0012ECAFD3|nr:hypothetical protein [Leisingera aquimarina]